MVVEGAGAGCPDAGGRLDKVQFGGSGRLTCPPEAPVIKASLPLSSLLGSSHGLKPDIVEVELRELSPVLLLFKGDSILSNHQLTIFKAQCETRLQINAETMSQ